MFPTSLPSRRVGSVFVLNSVSLFFIISFSTTLSLSVSSRDRPLRERERGREGGEEGREREREGGGEERERMRERVKTAGK